MAERFTVRFYEWSDAGAPYGWHVLMDGAVLDTYRERELADAYAAAANAREADGMNTNEEE